MTRTVGCCNDHVMIHLFDPVEIPAYNIPGLKEDECFAQDFMNIGFRGQEGRLDTLGIVDTGIDGLILAEHEIPLGFDLFLLGADLLVQLFQLLVRLRYLPVLLPDLPVIPPFLEVGVRNQEHNDADGCQSPDQGVAHGLLTPDGGVPGQQL